MSEKKDSTVDVESLNFDVEGRLTSLENLKSHDGGGCSVEKVVCGFGNFDGSDEKLLRCCVRCIDIFSSAI